jgi:uncharacterized tellurite resistance protein B-like protein
MVGAEMNATHRICKDLGLPSGDSFTQAWAYELPDEFRDETAFYKYISAYRREGYGSNEKRLLVQLTLDIANDLLQQDKEVGHKAWSALTELLRTNFELQKDQIEHWAMPGEPLEDAFALTPLARALCAEWDA